MTFSADLTFDSLLNFLGVIIVFAGTYWVARYQIKKEREIQKEILEKQLQAQNENVERQLQAERDQFNEQNKTEMIQFAEQIRLQEEREKPILAVVESSGRVNFEEKNETIFLKIVNAGETPAFNVKINIEAYILKYLYSVKAVKDLTKDMPKKIFKRDYDVIMPGDSINLPIFTSFDGIKEREMNNSFPMLSITVVESDDFLPLIVNVQGEDRHEKPLEEVNKVMFFKSESKKYTDETFEKLRYADYKILNSVEKFGK